MARVVMTKGSLLNLSCFMCVFCAQWLYDDPCLLLLRVVCALSSDREHEAFGKSERAV